MNFLQKFTYVLRSPRTLNYIFQRFIVHPKARAAITSRLVKKLPKAGVLDSQSRLISDELRSKGISFLDPLLTPDQCEEVKRYLSKKPLLERAGRGTPFFPSEPPAHCHIGVHKLGDLVDCPHLLTLANHPRLIGAAEAYLGCKPTISTFHAWWSFGGHDQPKDAEFFHRDVDDWKFVKFFIYLTDVGEEDGPHVFVRESQKVGKFLKIRRYLDEEIQSSFPPDDVLRICGSQGANFLEDTFGLHKGTVCGKGPRLIFQVQYSLFPIHAYKYSPVSIGSRMSEIDPYINRLFVTQ